MFSRTSSPLNEPHFARPELRRKEELGPDRHPRDRLILILAEDAEERDVDVRLRSERAVQRGGHRRRREQQNDWVGRGSGEIVGRGDEVLVGVVSTNPGV